MNNVSKKCSLDQSIQETIVKHGKQVYQRVKHT